MTMYDRIRDLRNKKGLSQQELAVLTGYSDRSSIAKIESGKVDLPQSKIIAIAQILDVSPAQLMGLVDEPVNVCSVSTLHLTPHERQVILAYRSRPEAQPFVDKLLELEPEAEDEPKQA